MTDRPHRGSYEAWLIARSGFEGCSGPGSVMTAPAISEGAADRNDILIACNP
jgi:hypothetical protein